jgi:cytochrome c oxidase cbb3-type subunit 2
MIRPLRAETLRYGHFSTAGEFVYDHPFQWGSKRTGPRLEEAASRSPMDGGAGPGLTPRSVRSEGAWIGSGRLQRACTVRRNHEPAPHAERSGAATVVR